MEDDTAIRGWRKLRLKNLYIIGSATAITYALNALYHGWRPAIPGWSHDAVAWASLTILLILYWAGYRELGAYAVQSSTRLISRFGISIATIALLTIPYDSTDAFLYVGMGWAQSHYGLNPYANVLRDVSNPTLDPMIGAEWMVFNKNPWLDLPLVYGPLFGSLIHGAAIAGQGNWWLTLFIVKLINVAAYALVAWLVWNIGRRLGHERADRAMYLFMWSPLILLHHIANGHNDLLMGCLILLAFYFVVIGRPLWAPSILVAAGMVKYLALVLVPLAVVVAARKHGWKYAGWSAALAVSTMAVTSLPYLEQISDFKFDLIIAQLDKITAGSLFGALYYTWRAFAGGTSAFLSLETFGRVLKVLLWAGSIVVLLRAVYAFCRRRDLTAERIAFTWAFILFVLIFGASSQFYAWYIGMVLPLALVLSPRHPLRDLMILLSGTHLVSFTSISRKAIGYFLLGTGAGVLGWRFRDRLQR
jgi:hypothetical protein